MSEWKNLVKAVDKWSLTKSTETLSEAAIAALAYSIGVNHYIGEDAAREEVAQHLMCDELGCVIDEVSFNEFGYEAEEPIPVTACVHDSDELGEPALIRPVRESGLLYLYTAFDDDRDQYWLSLVTILLIDCGMGNVEQCEVRAKASLEIARKRLLSGGRI